MIRLLCFVSVLALAACATVELEDQGPTPGDAAVRTRAATAFERLKALEGEWVTVEEEGHEPAGAVMSYRVTSGGSAVLETLFEGTDHEMVTLYYVDGDELVLTHYCVVGNQPHMRLAADSDLDALAFECVGGGNLVTHDEQHMHRGDLSLQGEDRMKSAWTMYEEGRPTGAKRFSLVRR